MVAGGGNAGLVAAISARHVSESVLLLERAPTWRRGGNSRHTRDIRYAHPPGEPYTSGEAYPTEELLDDLRRVGGGHKSDLADLIVEQSQTCAEWMTEHGVRWQQPLTGTLHMGRTNRFFLGGGKALINTYYQTAEAMGVQVEYEASVEDVVLDSASHRVSGVRVAYADREEVINARAVVLTSGGFEANLDWLRRYWGDAVDNYVIRGTPYNDGRVLACMLDKGAATAGDPKGFHAVALDARSPKFDGGIATRLDSVPFGVAVNKHGKRFFDEGQDLWPKRYAIWGRLIAEQPDQIAYSFVDSRTIDCFLTSLYRPYEGNTVEEVAAQMGLDPAAVGETIRTYNAAVRPGTFDPGHLDSCSTEGLDPPKSHWAQPLSQPPFYGYPLRPGITFTYLGLGVDAQSRVQMANGECMENLFAAGEIMSGNILSSGYLGGFGLTIGTVFGRISGTHAGRYARS